VETGAYRRYLVVPKASDERVALCECAEASTTEIALVCEVCGKARAAHIAQKPLALMKHLVRLVTVPGAGQLVLDPFAGSGTTGVACVGEGVDYLLIESDPQYAAIARARLRAVPAEQRDGVEDR
jgi:site-specific DNA-methyltransferase (adenine-specific)